MIFGPVEIAKRNWKIGSRTKTVLLYAVLPGVIVISLSVSIGTTYAQHYTGKIFPGVTVGPIELGGMTRQEATSKLSIAASSAVASGLSLSLDGQTKNIPLTIQGLSDSDTAHELIRFEIDDAVNAALAVGRADAFSGIFVPLLTLMRPNIVNLESTIDEHRLASAVFEAFPEANHPAVDAQYAITASQDGWQINILPEASGQVINTERLFSQIREQLQAELFLPVITLNTEVAEPTVTASMAKQLVAEVEWVLNAAPYSLTYTNDAGDYAFQIDAEMLMLGLAPTADRQSFSLSTNDQFATDLEALVAEVLAPAVDARLVMEDGKVKEFQGSQNGAVLNLSQTTLNLQSIWGQPNASAELVIEIVEPMVNVGDVNDLGISDILGVGTSNFSGSPTNRIKNIKNGARLLNGTLIAPNETFSLLQALKPFTTDNGYLAELVIKGDKIQPELGGGLCQIGTTTFRAAMNSGLPIVERRNHSLVVRYYNDPQNGNPGTDATIYEPAPDFKFLNDTGNYILLATDVDTTTGVLTFTLWGTSDGRVGSYSAPVVSSWISPGATRTVETLDLEPGKMQCQHSYPGANTSFTYTIKRSEDEIEETVFTSSYRALPEICLVGVAELSAPATDDQTSDTTETTADSATTTETPSDSPLGD